jgi:hypothetical protein
MKFITNKAIIFKGDRVVRGTILDLSAEDATRYASDVSPYGEPQEVVEPVVDNTPVEEMSIDQLKAKAKELGLKTTGSKADLTERITLHLGEITN